MLAVVVGMVIIGGLKSIAHVTERSHSLHGSHLCHAGLVIIIANSDKIGWAFGQIVSGAFR